MKLDKATTRTAALAAGVVLGSAALAFAVIFAVARGGARRPPAGVAVPSTLPGTATAAGEATPSADATAPYTIESTLPPGMTAEDAAADAAMQGAITAGVSRVAYVHDEQLKVTGESGGGESVIVGRWKPGGTYALSPDRRSIAYSQPDDDVPRSGLYVVRIGGTATRVADIAKGTGFGWSPDGARLAATLVNVSGRKVTARRLGLVPARGGSPVRFTFDGRDPAISPDGRQVVFLRPVSLAGATVMEPWRVDASGEGAEPVLPGVDASSLAWLDNRTLIMAERGAGGRGGRLMKVLADGTGLTELAEAPSARTSLHDVFVGGDSGMVAYDVVGDDGYSRIYTIRQDGVGNRALPGGLDVYPLSWNVDGDRLFYIEGNAWQDEPTALVSASPGGKGKKFLVFGARR